MSLLILAAAAAISASQQAVDAKAVANLDTAYQAAVKVNDAAGMARILHPDFVLILGSGAVVSRDALLESARTKAQVYEHQEEDAGTQTVRVFGDTAVVTARLWLKGANADGSGAFDRRLWFSDTYVKTSKGWLYALGQASTALPKT
jgi:uncharacterized protein (TIGR02246 family)